MPAVLLTLAIATLPPAVTVTRLPVQDPSDPRAVVHLASRAVQGDSASPLRARWEVRLGRDSTDRAARLGLATLAWLEYDYPAAERFAAPLLADSASDRFAVYARLSRADGFATRSMAARASEDFTRALVLARQAGDALAEGEALVRLAFARGRLRGTAVAQATLDSAKRLVPAAELAVWARIRDRQAILLSLRGSADAEAEARHSIALAREAGDRRTEADAWLTLGKVIQYRSDFDSALVALRHADSLYLAARARSALASSLIWQAQVLGGMGRFGEMREVMLRALEEGQATSNPGAIGDAFRAFGVLGIMTGDFVAARDNLTRAARIAAETGDSSGLLNTERFFADVALAAGDVAGARRLTQSMIARATEPREEFQLWTKLAAIEIQARDWRAAEEALARARPFVTLLPGGGAEAWLLHDEGRLALARGDLDRAEQLIERWLLYSPGETGAQMRHDAHLRLADIHARRGNVARAEREATAAAEELDAWRARLTDAELRVLVFQVTSMQNAAGTEARERNGRIARVLGALAQGGRGEVAFALAERRRARDLRDRLVRSAALRARPDSPTDRGRSAAGLPVQAADVASALPDDRTALLEFVTGAGGAPTTLFVVQRTGLVTRRLAPSDSVDEAIGRFAALLEDDAMPDALARSLGGALLDSAVAVLDPAITRLVIVPDGPLHHVTWDALRLADGRYAALRYSISVAPSAAVMAALWRQQPAAASARPVRLLALGDPIFPDSGTGADPARAAAAVYRAAFDSAGGLPRLRGSAHEARRVARYAPVAEVRLRDRASAAFLKGAALDSFAVIHIATHALVDERMAAGTALALAPGEGESGFVGAGELASLELAADVVVLSACRTAGGMVIGGEGVQGLTAPLLAAGARAVVATRWPIGDRSVTTFVESFYRALARGLPVGDALRDARLDAIRHGASPRVWAGFTATGDPMVTVPLRLPALWTGWLPLVASSALLALVAIGVVVWRRRRQLRLSAA